MGSGSPRARAEPLRRGPRGLSPAGLLLILAALLGSCGGGGGLPEALAAIDALSPGAGVGELEPGQGRRLDKAFAAAYRSASSSAHWLSLLKRAAALGPERLAEAGAAALEAAPSSETLAAALAYLELRAGRPERALALFSGSGAAGGAPGGAPAPRLGLSPESRPRLWAEAYLAARAAGRLPAALPEDLARLARVLEEPGLLAEAALLALEAGDGFAAAAYLRAARELGAEPPPALLGAAGLGPALAAPPAPAEELELLRSAREAGGGSEERLLVELLRLLEARPASPLLREAALRLLLERGRYPDFLTVFDSGEARGLDFPSRWFYAAAALSLRGRFAEAAALLEREAPRVPGPEGAFALGLLYAELGDYGLALERLELALGEARSPRERAAALKEIGRSRGRLGQAELARAAYRAAALADPEDAEAAFLADNH